MSVSDSGPSTPIDGRCMCGGVHFTVEPPLGPVNNCHCYRCRQFTGHHLATTSCAPSQVDLHASESLRWYAPVPGIEYGFCGTCGSSLFWRADDLGDFVAICAGVLDQPTGLRTTVAVWMAQHGDYHTPEPDVAEFDYGD